MENKEKIKSDAEHRYNLFSGFAIAIEIAAILKFFDIVRLVILENKIYSIDLMILGILFASAIGEEWITKIMFVRQKERSERSERQKYIVALIILLFIFLLTNFYFLLAPLFISAKLI